MAVSVSPPSPFIIGPPVTHTVTHAWEQRGPHPRSKEGGGGGQLQCHFLYKWRRQTRINKKKREGGINKIKEKRAEESGGKGGPDQARLFCETGEMWWRYMKSCFYLWCCAPLVIKLTGFIHCDILAS